MTALLSRIQHGLERLYRIATGVDIRDFMIAAEARTAALDDGARAPREQLLLAEDGGGLLVALFVDPIVVANLERHDPSAALGDHNAGDFLLALEGVSHFVYAVRCAQLERPVSALELELQAEVDKYALATCLLMRQARGQFHRGLHRRLFSQVGFLTTLDAQGRQRYWEANRGAANFCRRNDERYLSCRQPRIERWLGELRELFRCSHHHKMRRALS